MGIVGVIAVIAEDKVFVLAEFGQGEGVGWGLLDIGFFQGG